MKGMAEYYNDRSYLYNFPVTQSISQKANQVFCKYGCNVFITVCAKTRARLIDEHTVYMTECVDLNSSLQSKRLFDN